MTQLPETITKARARLLVRAPFFGSIALGLAWVNAPEVRTMATDGRRLWFNPAWCDQHGVEKIMGVIAHEVLHVVNKHHLRRGMRDPKLWNVAAGFRHVPVALALELRRRATQIEQHPMPGHQLADVLEQRAIATGIAESEHLGQ